MNTEGYGGRWINGQAFSLNPKCIVVGIAIAGIYALPRLRGASLAFMMVFIFLTSYIALSIYDVMYECNGQLTSGSLSHTGIFKPQDVHDRWSLPYGRKLAPNQSAMYQKSIYFTHATALAPLIMASSFIAMRDRKRYFDEKNIADAARSYGIHPVVFGLGTLALVYHSVRFFIPRDACAMCPPSALPIMTNM